MRLHQNGHKIVRIKEQQPPPHEKYTVQRNGMFFTATPCYGMHQPWWVVCTMAEDWPNEADPVAMQDDDQWWSITAGAKCEDCGEYPCECDPTDQGAFEPDNSSIPNARERQLMGTDKEPWR